MSDDTIRIRPLGAGAAELLERHAAAVPGARLVGENDAAELVAVTPDDLDELIEDAIATAAFARTRSQESVPAEFVARLLAGENRVRAWRHHRGRTLVALSQEAGIGKGYLSQIERGERAGTTATMKRLADALGVDIDDLLSSE